MQFPEAKWTFMCSDGREKTVDGSFKSTWIHFSLYPQHLHKDSSYIYKLSHKMYYTAVSLGSLM